MTGAATSIQARLQDALLAQARHDVMVGAHDACVTKLILLLHDMPWEATPAALAIRLFLALSTGNLSEAANIAFYLKGGFSVAVRSRALRDTLDGLAAWERLPAIVTALGMIHPLSDPDALIERLSAFALPPDDPAWARPATGGDPAAPLVIVSLANGLGNQIFQYAAGLRRARLSGGILKFDFSLFAGQHLSTRPFALAPFAIDVPPVTADDMVRVEPHVHTEDITRVDTGLLSGRGDCRLLGAWASPRYFGGVEAELRETLRLRDPALVRDAAAAVTTLRARGPVIGMHVRRGDYLAPIYRNAYAPLPVAYYRTALRCFPGARAIVIFSDTPADRDWCAETFADLGADVEVSHGRSDIEDFAYLAACDHQIISASSFSWWAAWLNPNPAKRVVAPHPALGPGPRSAQVLLAGRVPAEWLTLSRDDLDD
jgi:hypothetical protein